jgi:O-antigen ligase
MAQNILSWDEQEALARSIPAKPLRERLGSVIDRTIFFSLLVLVAGTAVPYGTVEPWWKAVFEVAVFFLACLWIIESLVTGSPWMTEWKLIAPLLGLFLFGIIQTVPLWGPSEAAGIRSNLLRTISTDPYATGRFTVGLLALIVAGALLLGHISSRARLRALIYAILVVSVASALFGLLRQTTQHDSPGFVLPYLSPGVGYAQFINRNHFAFLMEMGLGLALGLMFGGRVSLARRAVFIALGVPLWTALVLSNSRGGILSMIAQLLFMALLLTVGPRPVAGQPGGSLGRIWKLRSLRVPLASSLLGLLLLGIVWVGGDSLAGRFESVPGEISTESPTHSTIRRKDLWAATWRLIKAQPVTGVGFGGYWAAISTFDNTSGKWRAEQAHNDYLELLASGGLIGAALGSWFLVALLLRARRNFVVTADSFSRSASLGAMVGLFGVAIHSLVDFGLHIYINALVCTGLVVILLATQKFHGRSETKLTAANGPFEGTTRANY